MYKIFFLYLQGFLNLMIMLWKELVYMVLDELKLVSDDSTFTEDHVMFTLNKYRAFVLKQQYENIKKQIPESNYQTICLDLVKSSALNIDCCCNSYLRSVNKIPGIIGIGNTSVYPLNYLQGTNTVFISKDRLKYVGNNKYLQNIIYAANIDNYLYLKSYNPQFEYLKKIKVTSVFEDALAAIESSCEDSKPCNLLDNQFPMEVALIPTVLELTMKELAGPTWKPYDDINNANDDLSRLASFLARNAKSNLQKAIENE